MKIRKARHFAVATTSVFCFLAVACAKKEAPPPPADNAPMKSMGGKAGAAALPVPTVATAEVLTQNDAGAFVTKSARVNGTQSLDEALKVAKEEFPVDAQSRTSAIVDWSEERLRWADVDVKKNQTSTLLALKDPEGAYGKRTCLSGKLTSITAVRDADASALLHFKGVLEGPGERWNIAAVGDTGELVKGSSAKFCGLATHVHTQRADGGTVDILDVVGMFDLPENHKK